MPRSRTFPNCFDEAIRLSINDLRRRGYMRPDRVACRTYEWARVGQRSGSVNITVSVAERYVELDYSYNCRRINYRIALESITATFGGFDWYFICPATGKRCRKLYLIGERFLSRYAFPEARYRKQLEPMGLSGLGAMVRYLRANYEILAFVRTPYSKTYYKGKMTRRFKGLVDREARAFDLTGQMKRNSVFGKSRTPK
jgi:hypothetical protein